MFVSPIFKRKEDTPETTLRVADVGGSLVDLSELVATKPGPQISSTAETHQPDDTQDTRAKLLGITSELPKRRLEYVHVPKTGGTSVERAASEQGLAWSACHFKTHLDDFSKIPCPKTDLFFLFRRYAKVTSKGSDHVSGWHSCPPKLFSGQNDFYKGFTPYGDASLFTIVRNPYDRILSEWYYSTTREKDRNNAGLFNRKMVERLQEFAATGKYPKDPADFYLPNNPYFWYDGHNIPQHDFVFDGDKQVVDHVILYENVHADFHKLMQYYRLNVTISSQRTNAYSGQKKLTAKNFTTETLALVHKLYGRDFEEFGYEKVASVV